MTIEQRIRNTVVKKIKVHITNRKRSSTGFEVICLNEQSHATTKAQALQMLLAKVRCMDEIKIAIVVNPGKDTHA